MQRARDPGMLSPKWDAAITSLPSGLKWPWERGGQTECKSQKGGKASRKQSLLIKKVHVDSQRLRRHTQGLQGSAPGPLHTYYRLHFSVFMGFLNMQMSWSLILVVLSLGFFSSFVLSNSDMLHSLCVILYQYINILLSFRSLFTFSWETERE